MHSTGNARFTWQVCLNVASINLHYTVYYNRETASRYSFHIVNAKITGLYTTAFIHPGFCSFTLFHPPPPSPSFLFLRWKPVTPYFFYGKEKHRYSLVLFLFPVLIIFHVSFVHLSISTLIFVSPSPFHRYIYDTATLLPFMNLWSMRFLANDILTESLYFISSSTCTYIYSYYCWYISFSLGWPKYDSGFPHSLLVLIPTGYRHYFFPLLRVSTA